MAVVAVALLLIPAATAGTADPPTISIGPDGETADVFSYADAIRERVWIPVAGVDQDGDGVTDRVAIDIMRPAETEQGMKVPAIIFPSPYLTSVGVTSDDRFLHTDPVTGEPDGFPVWYDNYFVPRGYAVILAEANGTAFSTGCPLHGGPGDVASMKAVVDWLQGRVPGYDSVDGTNAVSADWDNGKAAMIGNSYNGTFANGVAATGVDGLTTIVPISPISDWYDYSRSNGARQNVTHYPASLSQTIDTNQGANVLGVVPPNRVTLCAGTRAEMSNEDGDDTGDMNAFWSARDYVPDVANVHASVLETFGLNDDNVKTDQLLDWWNGLAANNVPRKLWLSEDGHADPFDYRRAAWVDELHRWFDYWLYGIQNGIMSEPMVSIERAPGVWEDDSTWPLPNASNVDVYLQGSAAGVAGGLGDSSGGTQTTLAFTDAPTQSENQMIGSPTGSQANRLVFLSPVLTQDVHISGAPVVDLHAAFDRTTGDVGAILVDYSDTPFTTPTRNEGLRATTTRDCWGDSTALDSACYLQQVETTTTATAWRVSKGIMDAQNRDSLFAQTPLVPGTTYDFDFELLPNDYVFPAGHRIGVVIVSSYPGYTEATDRSSPAAALTVDTRATTIALPVVGGASAAEAAGMFGDSTAPTLRLPAPITVEATGPTTPVAYTATATDDRDPDPSVDCTPGSGSGFPVGTTRVQCTATDASGNSSTGAFDIAVEDTTAPTLQLPHPSAEATGPSGAAVAYDATATDLADPSPSVSCAPASGSTFPIGTTTVSCTATDASGNRAAGSFDVTVADTTAPTLTLPDAETVEAESASGASVTYTATATDAVDPAPGVDCSPASGTRFALGATTVHCTATDASGNVAHGTFAVTVADTTPPVLHLPGTVGASATSGAGATVGFVVTATDTVDGAPSISCSPGPGATFPLGTTTVHCTAKDASGNASSGSFDVVVSDSVAPTIHVPANMSAAATSAAGASVDYSASAADNVDPSPAFSCLPSSGSLFPIGTTTVLCTARDGSGNTASASFDVTVGDRTAPLLALPHGIVANAGGATRIVVRYAASATDAVDPSPAVSCSPASGSLFPLGRTVVRCTATDAAGNTARGSFVVEVTGAADVVKDIKRLLPRSKQGRKLAGELASLQKLVAAGRTKAACRALPALAEDAHTLSRAKRAAVSAAIRRLSRELRC